MAPFKALIVRKSPKSTLCDHLPGGGSPGRSVSLNLLPLSQKTKLQKTA